MFDTSSSDRWRWPLRVSFEQPGIALFIASDEDNIARIKRALRSVFADEGIDEISSADLSGAYPVIQYGPPGEDYVIDLLARLGETFTFDDIESEELAVEGVRVRVATRECSIG